MGKRFILTKNNLIRIYLYTSGKRKWLITNSNIKDQITLDSLGTYLSKKYLVKVYFYT